MSTTDPRMLEQRVAELEQALAEARSHDADHHRQLRRLATELSLSEARQRRAIAEDLHDHVGQALAFIKMKVSQFHGDAVFCGFEDRLSDILRLLNQTIDYTRTLTIELSPPMLYEIGLRAAIDWMAEQWQREYGLRVRVDGELDKSLSDDLACLLYKSVSELLANIVKHAQASHARVSLRRQPGEVEVVVSDDGVGFDVDRISAESASSPGFGLYSIRQRIGYLDGSMDIESTASRGTTVILTVPLQSEGQA